MEGNSRRNKTENLLYFSYKLQDDLEGPFAKMEKTKGRTVSGWAGQSLELCLGLVEGISYVGVK